MGLPKFKAWHHKALRMFSVREINSMNVLQLEDGGSTKGVCKHCPPDSLCYSPFVDASDVTLIWPPSDGNFYFGEDGVMRLSGTDIVLEVDGNQICAHHENFTNLQECPAGFGNSPEEAVEALRVEELKGGK
jgi:hypothetical protein